MCWSCIASLYVFYIISDTLHIALDFFIIIIKLGVNMRKNYIQRIILTTLFLSLVYIPNAIYAKSYGEAPMLAKMVKNGKLPNVNNRLPLDPLVVTPHERIGNNRKPKG